MNIKAGDVVELRQPGGNIIVTVGQVRGDHFIDMTGNRFMTRTVINLRSRVPDELAGFIDVPCSTHEAHGGGPTALDGVCEACGWIDESGNEPESHLPMGADVEHLVTGPHPDKITFKVDTDKLKVAIEQIKAKRHDPFSAYTDLLVEAELDERPVYAYASEDQLTTGTLVKYSRDVEASNYSGLSIGQWVILLTVAGGLVETTLTAVEHWESGVGRDEEGHETSRYFRIVVRDEGGEIIDAADYTIDMRG